MNHCPAQKNTCITRGHRVRDCRERGISDLQAEENVQARKFPHPTGALLTHLSENPLNAGLNSAIRLASASCPVGLFLLSPYSKKVNDVSEGEGVLNLPT